MYGMHKVKAILSGTVCASLAAFLFSAILSPAIAQTIVHPPVKTNELWRKFSDGPGVAEAWSGSPGYPGSKNRHVYRRLA